MCALVREGTAVAIRTAESIKMNRNSVVLIMAVVAAINMTVGFFLGRTLGEKDGRWRGEHHCKNAQRIDNENLLGLVRERAVFDFPVCKAKDSDTKRNTIILDVKIKQVLKRLKMIRLSVCEGKQVWYNCAGGSCSLSNRRTLLNTKQ